MLTIREIKGRTETFFKSKGVPNPRLDADILIAHALGMKRLNLYLELERPLTEAQLEKIRPLVKRRAQREPLQYVLGTVEFCGVQLKVDSRALIPRQETEELFERICEKFPAGGEGPKAILDLGSGTGALALALARKFPEAAVTAVELSADALSLARENADAQGLSARVRFLEGSWFTPLDAETERFDLIVSNPPYLTEAEMKTAEPEVVAYEPASALVAGKEGLDDLKRVLAGAATFLDPQGWLALETGIDQHATLKAMAEAAGFQSESFQDLSGRPRFFFVSRT